MFIDYVYHMPVSLVARSISTYSAGRCTFIKFILIFSFQCSRITETSNKLNNLQVHGFQYLVIFIEKYSFELIKNSILEESFNLDVVFKMVVS